MTAFFIAVLIFFGILMIVSEILFVPGLIVGILGGVFIIMGIGWTWQVYGAQAGMITAISSLLLTILSIWAAFRTGFWQKFSLQDKLEGRMNVINKEDVQTGDRGAAISSLRPMGTVKINGKKFQATTDGEMVPPNYPVVVLRIEADKLIVAPIRQV